MPDFEYDIPNEQNVTPRDIEPGADLRGTDLSGADLSGANLSGANLIKADLSEADLSEANLSEANLTRADLSEAILWEVNLTAASLEVADFSEAEMVYCNLKGADLSGADFSGTDLSGSKLTDVLLRDTSLSTALLSRGTNIDPPIQRLKEKPKTDPGLQSRPVKMWDAVARANNELKTAFSNNGLIDQAREARARERHARRREAKADETLRGTLAWFGSLLSRWTTGYGVKLLPVVVIMSALFLGSATVYSYLGMGVGESLYYSVVTFTTSPPRDPEPGIMRLVAGIETFLGTTMIVLLGYVLGAREQM